MHIKLHVSRLMNIAPNCRLYRKIIFVVILRECDKRNAVKVTVQLTQQDCYDVTETGHPRRRSPSSWLVDFGVKTSCLRRVAHPCTLSVAISWWKRDGSTGGDVCRCSARSTCQRTQLITSSLSRYDVLVILSDPYIGTTQSLSLSVHR